MFRTVLAAAACLLLSMTATGQGPVGGDGLSLRVVRAAIDKAIKAYYEDTEPPWTFENSRLLNPSYHFNNWRVEHAVGNHALMIWAALACGESYQNPQLYRRLNWVLSRDDSGTYDRGMRLLMLSELPPSRWGAWVRRDAVILSNAMTVPDEGEGVPGGAFDAKYSGGVSRGWGDAANSQYGALGLAAASASRMRVKTEVWRRVDRYWRLTQHKPAGEAADEQLKAGVVLPAGWSVKPPQKSKGAIPFYTRISGPMTAGAVSVLFRTERLLRGPDMKMGEELSPQVRRGIAWLDSNFTIHDSEEEADWYYYMYQLQNVGRATGYRTFNRVSWLREVTAELLRRQGQDGFWDGPKGKLLSTGFALLYLARANDPVAIAKVRWKVPLKVKARAGGRRKKAAGHAAGKGAEQTAESKPALVDGAWNNRPHDLWNFVEFVSDQYEAETTWQVVELDQSVGELIESPILYLTSSEALSFSDQQVQNLRGYIEAGGLLVTNGEGANTARVVRSIKELAGRLFEKRKLEKVPKEHPFYNLHQQVSPGMPMLMVDNGLRPLMVHMGRDIGEDLQKNRTSSDAFNVLSNVYLFATSMFPRRPRLHTNFVAQSFGDPQRVLPAARVRHGGTFDPEPNALRQLKAMLANEHDVNLKYDPKGTSVSKLADCKLAYLTTTGDGRLMAEEAAGLKRWVEGGGTLWIDAAGGSEQASRSAQEMFNAVTGNAAGVQLPRDHPIISMGRDGSGPKATVRYRFFALRTMGPARHARLFVHMIGRRPAIVLSLEDLTCGLAGLDHWKIFGYTPRSARRLAINGVLFVLASPSGGGEPVATR